MDGTINTEINYFLWSALLGLGLGFFYDLIRALRKTTTLPPWRVNLQDIIFLFLTGGVLFWTAYEKNGGQLRWQGILGTMGAMIVYYGLFKNHIRDFLMLCYGGLVRIWIGLVKIMLFPVCLVYRLLHRPVLVIGWYSKRTARRVGRILHIQSVRRQIYRRCAFWNGREEKRKRVDK